MDKDYSHHVEEKKQDTNEEKKKKALKESKEVITVKYRKMVINIGEGSLIKKEFGLEFLKGW